MTRPFVSVLIDTYNHERFIEEALVSALEQDLPMSDREILVVDDGSVDRTPEIIRKFVPHVRLLRKPNGGQASAFNVGIPECQGQIIAFLDGDDWWLPEKLSRVVEVLAAEEGVVLVGHGYKESTGNGLERALAPKMPERLKLDSLAAARVFRLRKSFLGTSRMTLRTAIARQLLPVPEELLIEADEYLFTLAAAVNEIVILREPLTCYRIHGRNLYLSSGGNQAGLRLKQRVMCALAAALRTNLALTGVHPEVVACVVEAVQAEADQMRLMLDGGRRWEAVRIERLMYEIMHADAPLAHRVLRQVTTLIALVLPPARYYAWRRWLGSRRWYRQLRSSTVPVPEVTGIEAPRELQA